ncbi:hypothetical protein [Oryzibacter oryziterrae]|uniref:hypothetical protein n=1 Tax=Oryzibacter oryziterrae TaxID=2766474 RepID=UPI001F1D6D8E|nr:hypothetical protein [Oryzibacter oryziterrae]
MLATTACSSDIEAATLSQRVQSLESKTDFYKKTNLSRIRVYRPRRASCTDYAAVILPLDLKNPAEIKVWMTYNVEYAVGASKLNWVLSTSTGDGKNTFGGTGCQNYRYNVTGSGKMKVKAYCSFSISAGDEVFAFLDFTDANSGLCMDNYITSFQANATITAIEMIEP